MLSIQEIEQKVAQLTANVEQSAANHHILVGTKIAYQELLNELKRKASEAAKDIEEAYKKLEEESKVTEGFAANHGFEAEQVIS